MFKKRLPATVRRLRYRTTCAKLWPRGSFNVRHLQFDAKKNSGRTTALLLIVESGSAIRPYVWLCRGAGVAGHKTPGRRGGYVRQRVAGSVEKVPAR